MTIEVLKLIFETILIVLVSKYVIVEALRKLAELLNLKPKIVGNVAGYASSIPELLTITISSIKGFARGEYL